LTLSISQWRENGENACIYVLESARHVGCYERAPPQSHEHNDPGEVSWYVIGSPSGLSRGNEQANPGNPHDSVIKISESLLRDVMGHCLA
jgi:hypothetical protein